MSISKDELAAGIRFAGDRVIAAAIYCKDWDFQLGHQWTARDAFSHVAATAPGLPHFYPLLEGGMLSGLGVSQVAASNAKSIHDIAQKSREAVIDLIRSGQEASAKFVESLDDEELQRVVTLGGYEMPKGEIVAQVWIQHAIAHAYEASARWPLQ